jgi:hypothetical protein
MLAQDPGGSVSRAGDDPTTTTELISGFLADVNW